MDKSILSIVLNTQANHPDRFCIVDLNGAHTYTDVVACAKIIAVTLRQLGVGKRDCVLVECNQTVDFVSADLACNMLGAYFTPIEYKASNERVNTIVEETEAKVVICDVDYSIKPEFGVRKIGFAEIFLDGNVKPLHDEIANFEYEMPVGDETSELLYTTGTTGKSKGIEITYTNNVALAENIACGTEMREGNVELIPLPLSHSHGLRTVYANILREGTSVIIDGVMNVKKIFELIENYKVTALDASPTAMSVLMKMSKGKIGDFDPQLDYIEVGTAALSEEIKNEMKRLFPTTRLYNFYGSTESGRSCALNFNSADDKKNCIGKPSVNAKFIITDENRNPIDSSETNTGLLACAGKMNMKGYWKHPDLTAEAVKDGYIFTKDESYIDEKGYVYVLGRKDDIINYKGIKIAPEEIEEVATDYEGVVDSGCIAVPDAVAGQAPKLYIQVEDEEAFDKKAFNSFLRDHIDANKQPKYIEIIEQIPRTYNGKLQRKKLRELN